jgi:uncharacterized membrane protein YeaQ/YmgE (transglycosylase-associated protein family)
LTYDSDASQFFNLKQTIMRSLGFFLIIMGIGSFVLHSMDREFRLLQWVDNWGATTGNVIRIAAAVIGAVLVFLSMRQKPAEEQSQDTPQ